MVRRRMATLVALALAAACDGCAEPESAPLTADQRSAIRTVTDWCAAYTRHDTGALDRILAEGYVFTSGSGETSTKADAIAAASKEAARYSLVENRDLAARIHGDTAVVTGRTRLAGTGADGAAFDVEFRFTDTLVRHGGGWKAVAAHTSRIAAR